MMNLFKKKKPEKKEEENKEEEIEKKKPWERTYFNGMIEATSTEDGMVSTGLTREATNRLNELNTINEVIQFMRNMETFTRVTILFSTVNDGMITSAIEYIGFKVLVKAALARYNHIETFENRETSNTIGEREPQEKISESLINNEKEGKSKFEFIKDSEESI